MEEVGDFDDDNVHILDYIAEVHAAFEERVDADAFARYRALYEAEPGILDASVMQEVLAERFGVYGAARIWNHYHDTWITEHDFQLARGMGFNFVRIPFWYRWFEDDDRPYAYHEYGFRYLDKAIEWAGKHNLYVLLDLHGAVGGQSPWEHSGELSRGEFFENPEFQKRTAALWKEIASRYGDNPVVWGYDALNEPFSAKGVEDWTAAHDLIYDAIREVDPDTIIVMEDGYKLEFPQWTNTGFFPDPAELGWENVVYSFHFYSGADPVFTTDAGLADHEGRAEEVKRIGLMEQERTGVPIYLGEFSTMGDHPNDIAGMEHFLTMFNDLGWHWSPWTWKYVNDTEEGSIWGIYQYAHPWESTPNFYRDSMDDILAVIDRLHLTEFTEKKAFADVLRKCLAQPVRSAAD
jgi:aryl-phospho-beta-D-glucosidase BglC (GH1 family)